ncbi:DDE superfamily endonuclease [Popillia japonica]|uniref:DDE superfamily endonuclease n=1 Tax=Popillia japonica TaxID=7064 RepID=A0AAW1JVH5_POPJA
MTPLLNPITPEEMLYNESHIRTRNVVERSYGIWKRRFPILKLEMRVKLQTAQTIIVATGVLHNIALQMADDLPEDNEEYINEIEVDNAAVPIANNNGNVRENLIRDYFSTLL